MSVVSIGVGCTLSSCVLHFHDFVVALSLYGGSTCFFPVGTICFSFTVCCGTIGNVFFGVWLWWWYLFCTVVVDYVHNGFVCCTSCT